jgi:hypothetical protein
LVDNTRSRTDSGSTASSRFPPCGPAAWARALSAPALRRRESTSTACPSDTPYCLANTARGSFSAKNASSIARRSSAGTTRPRAAAECCGGLSFGRRPASPCSAYALRQEHTDFVLSPCSRQKATSPKPLAAEIAKDLRLRLRAVARRRSAGLALRRVGPSALPAYAQARHSTSVVDLMSSNSLISTSCPHLRGIGRWRARSSRRGSHFVERDNRKMITRNDRLNSTPRSRPGLSLAVRAVPIGRRLPRPSWCSGP